jgi:hypothetical protein
LVIAVHRESLYKPQQGVWQAATCHSLEKSSNIVIQLLQTPVHSFSEKIPDGWASEKIALRKFSWLGKK